MEIAILGATGHIGKNLIYYLKDEPEINILCFGRSIEKTKSFLLFIDAKNCTPKSFPEFSDKHYDAVINCIGIGNPATLRNSGDEIFRLTEYYDNLILDYIKTNKSTVYINLSSGAVYGTDFRRPIDNSIITSIDVNNITSGDYYRISKLYSEIKHRSLSDLNIIDLRIFGFFSRFIELKNEFLLCEVINAIIEEKLFITGDENIIRDYVHPLDFVEIIKKCISCKNINQAFDVISKTPVSKFEILDFYRINYNLKIKVDSNLKFSSVTGSKVNYYSTNNNLSILKFIPKNTSMECIKTESEALFKLHSLSEWRKKLS